MPFDEPSPKPTPRSRTLRRIVGGVSLGLGALSALVGFTSEPISGLLGPSIWGNLREVDPGRFYRSGQLSARALDQTLDALGVRTIISLRGHSTHHDWYRDEARVAKERGVALHNIHLSARRLPRPEEIANLLALYRTAERPILVHCASGADRAGEASALYQIEHMGRTREEALEMLTLRQRHVAWLRPAKRRFIERYQGEDWVVGVYDPCSRDVRVELRPSTCDAPRP